MEQKIRIETASARARTVRIWLGDTEVRNVASASLKMDGEDGRVVLSLEILAIDGVEVNGFAECDITVLNVGDKTPLTQLSGSSLR